MNNTKHQFKVGDRVMWDGNPQDLGTIDDVMEHGHGRPPSYHIVWDDGIQEGWVHGDGMAPHITPYKVEESE